MACTPVIDQEGREVPAETKFNMLLHMNDSTVDTKYTDRWIYGDALKPVITIFTDPNTGMVYIGHYNEDGILDTEHCM